MLWVTKTIVLPRLRPEPQEQQVHLVAGERVERAEGLVHQQHGGVLRERPHDRGALLHAARELARVGLLEAAEARLLEQRLDRAASSGGRRLISNGNSMFWRRLRQGRRFASWKIIPISCGSRPYHRLPSSRICPRVRAWSPPSPRAASSCRSRSGRGCRRARRRATSSETSSSACTARSSSRRPSSQSRSRDLVRLPLPELRTNPPRPGSRTA